MASITSFLFSWIRVPRTYTLPLYHVLQLRILRKPQRPWFESGMSLTLRAMTKRCNHICASMISASSNAINNQGSPCDCGVLIVFEGMVAPSCIFCAFQLWVHCWCVYRAELFDEWNPPGDESFLRVHIFILYHFENITLFVLRFCARDLMS